MSGIHMALMGSSADAVISITDQNISYSSGGLTQSTAGYRLNANGQAEANEQNSYSTLEQWCTPTSAASNYEVRATMNYGTLASGTVGSWLALSSSREWTVFASIGTNEQAGFTVEIRRTGTTTVLDSATITLEADAIL